MCYIDNFFIINPTLLFVKFRNIVQEWRLNYYADFIALIVQIKNEQQKLLKNWWALSLIPWVWLTTLYMCYTYYYLVYLSKWSRIKFLHSYSFYLVI